MKVCPNCNVEMIRDKSMLARIKKDVITYKCLNCGKKILKGIKFSLTDEEIEESSRLTNIYPIRFKEK